MGLKNLKQFWQPVTSRRKSFRANFALFMLRATIGIVFLWFGFLKFFVASSPAEDIAIATMSKLTFELVDESTLLVLLAVFETLLGVLLMIGKYIKQVCIISILHLFGTFTTVALFPEDLFVTFPFEFTLLGQYVFKNVILIAALIALLARELERPDTLEVMQYVPRDKSGTKQPV
ncbi:MAG: hypothetical protein WBA16_00715 [Nonlabens sp.]